jgi:hypothetical protein
LYVLDILSGKINKKFVSTVELFLKYITNMYNGTFFDNRTNMTEIMASTLSGALMHTLEVGLNLREGARSISATSVNTSLNSLRSTARATVSLTKNDGSWSSIIELYLKE